LLAEYDALSGGYEGLVLPIGVVVFPGSEISDNHADKSDEPSIPPFDLRVEGGA
jgi:hypothetical protein